MPSWLSLLPPLIVLAIVSLTQRLNLSLSIGIGISALIATQGNILQTLRLIGSLIVDQLTDFDNLYLYGFLLTIALLVVLFATTGAANAFAYAITKRLTTTKDVKRSTMLLSLLLFIDDYLSILTTGHVMRPLADHYGIPRAKLAFLIHSLAGSVVILTPVSSWVAAITSYLEQAGIAMDPTENIKVLADPFYVYLKSIPFIFYSFLIIASVWFIIRTNISYGPMRRQELATEPLSQTHSLNKKGTLTDFVLPLVSLITFVIAGLAISGGYNPFIGDVTFVQAFKHNANTFLILFLGALFASAISFGLSYVKNKVSFNALPSLIYQAYELMGSAILMVFLASILGLLLRNELKTGAYLAQLLIGTISLSYLPVLLFIVSFLSAVATGSAWGTFALMLYIGIPMITNWHQGPLPVDPSVLPILFPSLGAIFSGAVCGDHISPLSETTIMAATSTQVPPVVHTQTQLPYTIPAVVSSLISFALLGVLLSYTTLFWSWLIALSVGLTSCFGLLLLFNRK